ncbi:MAG: site-2 protease family protein [Cytophagales bacterium]|nr:site-2 protease family protein [Cytophagales bacterium]
MTENKRNLLHLGLFLITIVTTTLAGVEWTWSRYLFWGEITMSWQDFTGALNFSIPFLLILSFHEFGHYFTARHHNIKVSLPYYFPFWLGFIAAPSLGTMGAFIRIREVIKSRTHYFDVGISGPLAGFVIALGVLWYGFASLPETEYIYEVHPEYELFGENFEEAMAGLDTVVLKSDLNPERYQYEMYDDTIRIGPGSIYFGDNLLMNWGRKYVAPKDRYIPSSKEIMHYPWLLAGYLALFFTALNLLPIGQLDGGHVVYGLFGSVWHKRISTVLFSIFLFYAGLGWIKMSDMSGDSTTDALNFIFQVGIYLYVLYICTYSMFPQKRDRWMYAAIMLAVQFFLSSFLGWQGYNGWVLFAILLGRFVGIQHPPAADDRPLTTNRKILGWIALIIFILCFTPEPMVVDM